MVPPASHSPEWARDRVPAHRRWAISSGAAADRPAIKALSRPSIAPAIWLATRGTSKAARRAPSASMCRSTAVSSDARASAILRPVPPSNRRLADLGRPKRSRRRTLLKTGEVLRTPRDGAFDKLRACLAAPTLSRKLNQPNVQTGRAAQCCRIGQKPTARRSSDGHQSPTPYRPISEDLPRPNLNS